MGGSSGPAAITILYEGRPLACRPGTSVGVALWERGVRVLSHSPKYGRPRGLFCARGHCTSCLMRIDGVPNVRACQTPVRQGMQVERQDAGAWYGRPLQRLMETAAPLFPTGFYFRWFTRPAPLRRLFLRNLRPLTGIGRLPDPDGWEPAAGEQLPGEPPAALPDVDAAGAPSFAAIVAGAGVWGLREAARLAGPASGNGGARVLLVDDHREPGGQRRPALEAVAEAFGEDMGGLASLRRARAALLEAAGALAGAAVERGLGWRVVGAWRPGVLVLHDGAGLRAARAGTIVWAAGALDCLGLFPGNDLPGLFGPRGLYRAVARDGMDVRGLRAVVCGGGLDACLAAALLEARGARPTLALSDPDFSAESRAAAARGWEVHVGRRLLDAGRRPRDRLRLRFGPVTAAGEAEGPADLQLTCDLAVVCERGKPAYDLPYQLGCQLVLQPARGGYLPAGDADGDAWEGVLPGGPRLRVGGEAWGALPPELLEPGAAGARAPGRERER